MFVGDQPMTQEGMYVGDQPMRYIGDQSMGQDGMCVGDQPMVVRSYVYWVNRGTEKVLHCFRCRVDSKHTPLILILHSGYQL